MNHFFNLKFNQLNLMITLLPSQNCIMSTHPNYSTSLERVKKKINFKKIIFL